MNGVILPDGSGFFTASLPLPDGHWLHAEGMNVPPMGMRTGYSHPGRKDMKEKIVAAARYAVRASTMNGKESDFDPDALVQNMVTGLLGYHTANGLSDEAWMNPPQEGDDHERN